MGGLCFRSRSVLEFLDYELTSGRQLMTASDTTFSISPCSCPVKLESGSEFPLECESSFQLSAQKLAPKNVVSPILPGALFVRLPVDVTTATLPYESKQTALTVPWEGSTTVSASSENSSS